VVQGILLWRTHATILFVSGGLFYVTRINKQWKWKDLVVDKQKRLGIPYLFFITFAGVPKRAIGIE